MSRDMLAQAVLARRGELGLTQEELAVAGSVSSATLRKIEGASTTANYGARTLFAVDTGLGWRAGTARSILAGGTLPVEDVDDPEPRTAAWLVLARDYLDNPDAYEPVEVTGIVSALLAIVESS